MADAGSPRLEPSDRVQHANGTWREVEIQLVNLLAQPAVWPAGHEAGDLLLTATSHPLLAAVRAWDTVARFGGDEFAVLLETVADVDEAMACAERIAAAIRAPLDLFGRELTVEGASAWR